MDSLQCGPDHPVVCLVEGFGLSGAAVSPFAQSSSTRLRTGLSKGPSAPQ